MVNFQIKTTDKKSRWKKAYYDDERSVQIEREIEKRSGCNKVGSGRVVREVVNNLLKYTRGFFILFYFLTFSEKERAAAIKRTELSFIALLLTCVALSYLLEKV